MANIVLQLSTGSLTATTNSTPSQSLGGNMATNSQATITTSNNTLDNLWSDISKSQNLAGTTDYRCVFIYNDDSTLGDTFSNGTIYISGTSLATFEIGLASVKNTATVVIANSNTAPSGITFSAPTSSSPLSLLASSNVLNPDDYIALWIKRTASNITGSSTVTDTLTLVINGVE